MDEPISMETLIGLVIPFAGTVLGAATVLFMKKALSENITLALTGFAAGVMTAASVWSLLLPAIEQSQGLGSLSFLPSCIGFWAGILFLMILDRVISRLCFDCDAEDQQNNSSLRTTMMVLAITLHNIPEGMAVGVAYAGFLTGDIPLGGALALALGIGIQNLPEGAIVSMPLHAQGKGKARSFFGGALSGAVEPLFGGLTVLCAALIIPAMPYLLSFAAGAMICVVVEDLIPEISQGVHSRTGVIFFAVGFSVMMALDVALG